MMPAGVDGRHRHAFGSAIPERARNSMRCSTMFRRLLKPGGLLVLGDVIPHRLTAIEDARALLHSAGRRGFSGRPSRA